MPSAEPTSRSPSPPTAPPVGDAPGPRATALINVFNNALEATIKRCSYANFADCFPTPAKHVPETLDSFHRQFVERLGAVCKAQFENILTERNVVPSLNGLDQAIADAKKRKERAEVAANGGPVEAPVPPHTLPPSTLHIAHLLPFLQDQTATINTALSETQAANTELLSTITAQRAEIEALVQALENVVGDLEKSAALLSSEEVQGLGGEVRSVEAESRG